ncbi:MAG TPA: hypothetical protein VI456_11860 [Polyangia bacterium]
MREAVVRQWGTTVGLLAALASACGGGPSASPAPTVGTACADYANKACMAAQKCEPGIIQYFYPGGLANCVATSALTCQASIESPHSGASPALLQQCGSALAAMTCEQYFSASTDPSCLPHAGTIAIGGSCGDSWQCASGRCALASAGCGTCVPQVGLGAPCTGIECADGLVCSASARGSTSYVCSKPVSLGEPCFDANVCPGNSSCGTTSGTCDPLPGGGETCDTMNTLCDYSAGLFLCDPYLGVCEAPVGTAQSGQACGWLTTTSPYVACDGLCEGDPASNAGTCFSELAQGQACAGADLCGYDLQCVGGVCIPIGPTACDGTPVDAGSEPVDAGSGPTDAGSDVVTDAGLSRLDATVD